MNVLFTRWKFRLEVHSSS